MGQPRHMRKFTVVREPAGRERVLFAVCISGRVFGSSRWRYYACRNEVSEGC